LVAGIVDLEHAEPGAVVDGRELIELLLGPADPLEEFHIELQPKAGLGFLVSLPAAAVRAVFLIGRQPIHPVSHEHPVNTRHGQRHVMKASQIVRNLAGPKRVVLP